MYRIGILEKDEAYLGILVDFLWKHHKDSFEIHVADQKNDAEWANLGLKDLDTDTVEYDALFFGDGVHMKDKLPEGIITGFITEKEQRNDNEINKYQSFEKIYSEMMELCEGGKKTASAFGPDSGAGDWLYSSCHLKPETVTVEGETYRTYAIDEADVDKLALRMLAGGNIKGLPHTQYKAGRLHACITGMRSLYDVVRENNTAEGKQELLKYLGSMAATALSLEEYMLSTDRLLLDPNEIYVREGMREAVIPYIPMQSGDKKDSRQFLEEFREFCGMLLEGFGKPAESTRAMDKKAAVGPPPLQAKHIEPKPLKAKPAQAKQPEEKPSRQAKANPPQEGSGEAAGTEAFEDLRRNAEESLELKNKTEHLTKETMAYMVRKRTGEKTVINRNIFKLGKDASYVDYLIKDNPTVSRNHADIVRRADGFYLVDKGSLNHTFVDGKKLEAGEYKKLEDGCLFQLADEVFEFSVTVI